MTAALIIMIVSLGVLYVVLPVVADTFHRLQGTRTVTCPETDESATIEFDAVHAALRSAVGPPDLQVRRCSHWPERERCGQECLAQVDSLAAKGKAA